MSIDQIQTIIFKNSGMNIENLQEIVITEDLIFRPNNKNELKAKLIEIVFQNIPTNIVEWDLSRITNMSELFEGITSFTHLGFITNWDVSNVTNMGWMFNGCTHFNQPLNWNVSNVTNMTAMFKDCTDFNQPLNWNVSNVTNMSAMFFGCTDFNQPLNWDVSNVRNMGNMFLGCTHFNQPLNNWDVSNVRSMSYMFLGCTHFNQQLNNWNVSNVRSMHGMFYNCFNFNQQLNNWNVSNVTNVIDMFENCFTFNQPLNNWRFNMPINELHRRVFHNSGMSAENLQGLVVIMPPPPPQHQGVAFEIHNKFGALPLNKIMNFFARFNQDNPINQKTVENQVGAIYLFSPLLNFIRESELFHINIRIIDQRRERIINEKETYTADLNRIFGRIQPANIVEVFRDSPVSMNVLTQIFQLAIDFVTRQDDHFIEQYIRTYSMDCLHAYTGANQSSCTKGLFERIVTIVYEVAKNILRDFPQNKICQDIVTAFFSIDFNEAVQEWASKYLPDDPTKSELYALTVNERKEHFINFMREKYGPDALDIEAKIQDEAARYDYVFENLAFGFKRKKTRKNRYKQRKNSKKEKKYAKKQSKKKEKKNNKVIKKKLTKKI